MFSKLEDLFLLSGRRRDRGAEYIFIARQWKRVMGREICSKTEITGIRENVIYIGAVNPVWASHLTQMKKELLDRLNGAIKPLKLKDIRFKAVYPLKKNESPPAEKQPAPQAELGEEEKACIEKAAGFISDGRLREKVESIMRHDLIWQQEKKRRGVRNCIRCGRLDDTLHRGLCLSCRKSR